MHGKCSKTQQQQQGSNKTCFYPPLLHFLSYLFHVFFFFICFKVDSTKYVTMMFNIIQSTLPKSILHFTWIHSQKWKKYDSNKKWKIICSKSKHKHKFYGAVFFSYCKFEHNETREKNKYNFILWKERKLQNDCVILKWNKLSSKRHQQKERKNGKLLLLFFMKNKHKWN